ncbi:MAG TPA: hypothetical protein VGM01_08520 [Ktedonobacteraceae bacterium]
MRQCIPRLQKAVARPLPTVTRTVGIVTPTVTFCATLGAKEGNARSLPFQAVEPLSSRLCNSPGLIA